MAENPNIIKFGSTRHAQLLGLRKANSDDEQDLVIEKLALNDITAYGPVATTRFLKATLRQKVNELMAGGPPVPQSLDFHKPNYAPAMWQPS